MILRLHRHLASHASLFVAAAVGCLGSSTVFADEHTLDKFDRQTLTDVYYSEGAGAGDLDNDGHVDIVYGPYWYAGPDFKTAHEIFPAEPQNRDRYANHFFAWVYDFDGDGWNDVFTVGFPGTPAYVYKNPGKEGHDQPWPKHEVFNSVSNESPHFTNLVGDERPELICTRDGHFGYAEPDWSRPFEPWTWRVISGEIASKSFGHGLGVGDLNGDGHQDVLLKDGWLEQPADLEGNVRWNFHPVEFTKRGGAEMYAYDVDGDGDNDVITSLEAHEFGLAWFENIPSGDGIEFKRHLIMGSRPEDNRYGLVFTEPHSVNLADIDGDGLKDIITGKTYWSHHRQSPMWDAGAVVYWFRLVRGDDGVDWVPYLADGDAGIGRQIFVHDINGDQLPDIVVGGMKGCSVLTHRRESVTPEEWQQAQPKPYDGPMAKVERGEPSRISATTGRVPKALEGEKLKVLGVTEGKVSKQQMSNFTADRWSGDAQLFWTGAKPGARLDLEFPIKNESVYLLECALTMARDCATVRLMLDDEPLGEPLDLFHHPDVVTTGVLKLGHHKLAPGTHKLSIEIIGANPAAAKAYLVGLDYIRIVPTAR